MRPYFAIGLFLFGLMIAMSLANVAPFVLIRRFPVQEVRIVPPDLDALRVSAAAAVGDISIGGDTASLTEKLKHLKTLAAEPGEAPSHNRRLNVAVVLPEEDASGQSKQPAAPNLTVLNLEGAGDAGFVLFSNGPAVWKIRNAPPAARAKIAVESEAAFDLIDAPPGLLAGFRVAAFGAPLVAAPTDYIGDRDPYRFQRFCSSIRNWAAFFNVAFQDVRIWAYRHPGELDLRSTQIAARGQEPQWARSISFDCDPPPPTPRTVFPPLPPPARVVRRH
jgi:hypothetical protein